MDKRQYVVKNQPHLVRDGYSKAIINTNKALLDEHRQKKMIFDNVNTLNRDINILKSEINEIKSLLTQLIQK